MGKPFESFTKKQTKRNAKNAHILIFGTQTDCIFSRNMEERERGRKGEGEWGTKT